MSGASLPALFDHRLAAQKADMTGSAGGFQSDTVGLGR